MDNKSDMCDAVKQAMVLNDLGSITGFVRYRSVPEFCSKLNTYVVTLIYI